MTRVKAIGIGIGLFLMLLSCDGNRVFDEYQSISGGWAKEDTIKFTLPDLDSIQPYRLFINLRNDNSYPYSNLFLITKMQFPKGKIITDTLEYEMAAPDGQWLGTGFTTIKESKLIYKDPVLFSEQGVYTIAIEHAMRQQGEAEGIENLPGITDIGFRIEYVTNH